MNSHLKISKSIQAIIDDIQNIDLCLAELPMPEHPKLPQFNRVIRVYDIDAKSRTEFAFFIYEQVLKDKETGEKVNITLPTPSWEIYKETWSYLRGSDNLPIEAPLKDAQLGEELLEKEKIRVPSYKYMIWLMKNGKSDFLQLIQGYLASFIESKIEDLNKL